MVLDPFKTAEVEKPERQTEGRGVHAHRTVKIDASVHPDAAKEFDILDTSFHEPKPYKVAKAFAKGEVLDEALVATGFEQAVVQASLHQLPLQNPLRMVRVSQPSVRLT